MTRQQLINHYGNTRTKDIAGILHNYLFGSSIEEHQLLEDKILSHGELKIKDSIKFLDDLLEFESDED
jgi:hypothetical protein